MTRGRGFGMYRYQIEFSANTLDETELREFLEEYFAVSNVSITRVPGGMPGRYEASNRFEQLILAALETGKPARRKHLLAVAESKSQRIAITSALLRLEERGAIRKPRHGVFIIADAPDPRKEDIPSMDAAFARPTQDRIMQMLTTPKTAVELREETGVSRQRIEQIVSKLTEKGLVTRNEVSGERGQYIYIRTDVQDRNLLLTRPPHLSDARARVLSALPAETICWIQTVGDLVALSRPQLAIWFEQFSAQGLVTTFRLSQHRYVGLTARGFEHPQYDIAVPKAAGADLVADFGPKRTMFLQVLFALGELKTIDITRALPEDALDDVAYSSGQVIQRLESSRLIESVPGKARKQVSYRLTPKGRFATAVLNHLQHPPSAEELRTEMERRRKKYTERMRQHGLNCLGSIAVGSPTQEAAVRALREHGSLTQRQINDLMDIRFKNRRSLYLALCQMEKRGVVRRVRGLDDKLRTGPHGAQLWECGDLAQSSPQSTPSGSSTGAP